MKLATMLERIWRDHQDVTEDDIRGVFGDYHNVLNWLAVFLLEDKKLAEACVVDACTISKMQTPVFHEWLVHWAARATFRSAFLVQREHIAELASRYEQDTSIAEESQPLSVTQLRLLIDNSEDIRRRLDVLCRFVVVLRGIAKESADEAANELGISPGAIERSYRLGLDCLNVAEEHLSCVTIVPQCEADGKRTLRCQFE